MKCWIRPKYNEQRRLRIKVKLFLENLWGYFALLFVISIFRVLLPLSYHSFTYTPTHTLSSSSSSSFHNVYIINVILPNYHHLFHHHQGSHYAFCTTHSSISKLLSEGRFGIILKVLPTSIVIVKLLLYILVSYTIASFPNSILLYHFSSIVYYWTIRICSDLLCFYAMSKI